MVVVTSRPVTVMVNIMLTYVVDDVAMTVAGMLRYVISVSMGQ